MTSALSAAIPRTPDRIITSWLQLEDYLDHYHSRDDVNCLHVNELMDLWCCTQPTVSRRLAGINKAGLATIERANGFHGGWWVMR
jgi:hypothetical protein